MVVIVNSICWFDYCCYEIILSLVSCSFISQRCVYKHMHMLSILSCLFKRRKLKLRQIRQAVWLGSDWLSDWVSDVFNKWQHQLTWVILDYETSAGHGRCATFTLNFVKIGCVIFRNSANKLTNADETEPAWHVCHVGFVSSAFVSLLAELRKTTQPIFTKFSVKVAHGPWRNS